MTLEQFKEFYTNEISDKVYTTFNAHCVRYPQEPEQAFQMRTRRLLLARRQEVVGDHVKRVAEVLRRRYNAVGVRLVVNDPKAKGI